MAQRYKRPPITEAVIEIRLEAPVSKETIDRLQKKLLEEYPAPPQEGHLWNFEIGDAAAKVQQQFQAYKLTSADGADVVAIGMNLIATSRLAPYEGWEPFSERAKANWDIWKRIAGYQKIARIGVRYINRIDIPGAEGTAVLISDYLRVFPMVPNFGRAMDNFAMNVVEPIGLEGCRLVLNVSSAPSPLVKGMSFILDLDISRETDLPQSDEGIWSLISQIRGQKNLLFEMCITDRSRQLFSQ